jgi:hypothetical protein
MTTFIVIYHSGLIITNEIDSYRFVGMKETFLSNEFLTLQNLVGLECERLGWMDEGVNSILKVKLICGRVMTLR